MAPTQVRITEFLGLRAIEYGFEHPLFTQEHIKAATGLDDETWHHYWHRVKMVNQLDDNLFCLTTEAVALYLQVLSFQHAERESRRANRLATIAILVTVVGTAASLFVV